jgi:iron-sulfur cluster assembly protein
MAVMEISVLPLRLTAQALQQVKQIMAAKNISAQEYGLRIGLRGGGCGATFLLGFDKPEPSDTHYRIEEIMVYIDKKHLMYVIGLEIDYEETDSGTGFTFNNPTQEV